MPTRTLPLAQITEATLLDLIVREAQEDRTLDFKRELPLDGPEKLTEPGKTDFLVDVTAMANASGGTILYGAEEGTGREAGQIVSLRGMELHPDQLGLTLKNLLRNGIDAALGTIDGHAVRLGDGKYCYLVRVPPSPIAPHMIALKESRRANRFFVRGPRGNDPMNAQQIREAVLRSETVYDRIEKRIADRIVKIDEQAARYAGRLNVGGEMRGGADFYVLHALPLFSQGRRIDLASREIQNRWRLLVPFGRADTIQTRHSLAGLASEVPDYRPEGGGLTRAWILLMRDGGVEFVQIDAADRPRVPGGPRILDAAELELDIIRAVEQVRALADEGFLSLPLVLSLQLGRIGGLIASAGRLGRSSYQTSEPYVPIAPVIIESWDECDTALRDLFNIMWQSWGAPRSPFYRDDGSRIER